MAGNTTYQPPYFQEPGGSLLDRYHAFVVYWDKFFQYTRNFLNNVDASPVTAVASAATVVPLRQVQPISGAATISTISLPPGVFNNVVTLLSEGGFALATGGNIAAARTVTTGNAVTLYFNVRDSKWYPD